MPIEVIIDEDIITRSEEVEEADKFPMLMQNPHSKTIILVTARKDNNAYKGFILADTTNNPREMGTYSDHWKKDLVPYEGNIVLRNPK